MKSSVHLLIFVLLSLFAGQSHAGESNPDSPCHCNAYALPSVTNTPQLEHDLSRSAHEALPVFFEEEDFSKDKRMEVPLVFLYDRDHNYALPSRLALTNKRKTGRSELIMGKPPIYLLYHTLRIPFI